MNYSFDQFSGLAAWDQLAIAPEAQLAQEKGQETATTRQKREGEGPSAGAAPSPSGVDFGGAMGRYLIRRTLFMILVLFIVSLITFIIFVKLPASDPARRAAGKRRPRRTSRQPATHSGSTRPLYVQYSRFAKGLIPWPGLFLNEDVYYSYATSSR